MWAGMTMMSLTLFMISFLRAPAGWGKSPTFLKICHIYSKMLKFGTVIHCQKTSKKNINHVAHPLSSADIINFLPEVTNFSYLKKYKYKFHFNT